MNKLCIAAAALMLLAGIEGARAFLLLGGLGGTSPPFTACATPFVASATTLFVDGNNNLLKIGC